MELGSCLGLFYENELDQQIAQQRQGWWCSLLTEQLQLHKISQSGGEKPNPKRDFLLAVAPETQSMCRYPMLPPGAGLCLLEAGSWGP